MGVVRTLDMPRVIQNDKWTTSRERGPVDKDYLKDQLTKGIFWEFKDILCKE